MSLQKKIAEIESEVKSRSTRSFGIKVGRSLCDDLKSSGKIIEAEKN